MTMCKVNKAISVILMAVALFFIGAYSYDWYTMGDSFTVSPVYAVFFWWLIFVNNLASLSISRKCGEE